MARVVLALLVVPACIHRPAAPASPSAVLVAWADAVERDDPQAAYAQLSAPTRARLPATEFRARWQSNRDERRTQAAQVRAASLVDAAKAITFDGREAPLTRDPDGWRLVTPRARAPGAPTPDEALRRFVRALESHNFDALLDLLSAQLRAEVERELADRLAGLRRLLARPVAVEGERAHLQYDARFHVDLEREGSDWRVSDFN